MHMTLRINILLLTALSLCSPLFANEFLKAISRAFPIASPVAILIAGLVIIILLTIVVAWEIYRVNSERQERLELSWLNYNEKAKSSNLSDDEDRLLRKIIMAGDEARADAHFDNATIYEKSLEAFLASIDKKKGGSIPWTLLHEVRKKLGFHQLPMELRLTSTRQLHGGIKPSFINKKTGQKFTGKIIEVSEDAWALQMLDDNMTWMQAGQSLPITFIRSGDAEYELEVIVQSVIHDVVYLPHTSDLTRKQLRNWVRIDVNLPCKVQVEKLPADTPAGNPSKGSSHSGRITDISGGGVCLRLPSSIPAGSVVLLSFDLPHSPMRNVRADILSYSTQDSGERAQYIHRTKFQDLDTGLQERIVRFVFEKNRVDNQLR